jgi:hypothetical protein
MGLYSINLEDLGDNLCTGHLSLGEFRAYFNRGPICLRDIQVAKVHIVDHLGEVLSVPIIFCSSWKVCPLVSCVFAVNHFD